MSVEGVGARRLRDWDGDGIHPGYALSCWLREHVDQVWLFATRFGVEWTNNSSERAVKDPKRHQAVSGVLAHPADRRPLVPHPQLPRLSRQSRPRRVRRHHQRPDRRTLAPSPSTCRHSGRSLKIIPYPVNGHQPCVAKTITDAVYSLLHWLPQRLACFCRVAVSI